MVLDKREPKAERHLNSLVCTSLQHAPEDSAGSGLQHPFMRASYHPFCASHWGHGDERHAPALREVKGEHRHPNARSHSHRGTRKGKWEREGGRRKSGWEAGRIVGRQKLDERME